MAAIRTPIEVDTSTRLASRIARLSRAQRWVWLALVLIFGAWTAPSGAQQSDTQTKPNRSAGAPTRANAGGPTPGPSSHDRPAPGSTLPAPSPAASSDTESGADAKTASDQDSAQKHADVARLEKLAAQLRALLDGKLEPGVDAADLFSTPLDDEDRVRVEVERLRYVVERAERNAAPAEPTPAPSAAAPKVEATAGPVAAEAKSDSALEYERLRRLDPALWKAQLAVDRAQLEFLRKTPEERQKLLNALQETKLEKTETALGKAEQKAREAEAERQKALEAAKRARSEAARLVVEEQARLLNVKKQQAQFDTELLKRSRAIDERREKFLGVQRRVREALASVQTDPGDRSPANAMYDSVRSELKEARNSLSAAISELTSSTSRVPTAGPQRLQDVPQGIDTKRVRELRTELEAAAQKLTVREDELREKRSELLYRVIVELNDDRLDLLSVLSADKRAAVKGFGPAGIDQALAEGRQVALVMRYHLAATRRWLLSMKNPGAQRGQSALAAGLIALKWLLPIVVFVWWRRRADGLLRALLDNLNEGHRIADTRSRIAVRVVEYLRRIRVPLEWLLLIWAIVWLLPEDAKDLLEVQLPQLVLTWTLGGTLVVHTIDFLAGQHAKVRSRYSQVHTAHIRLRSLRLMGRVIVGFGLLLSLSDELVGKGTLYGWVWRFCWFAAIPVLLVIVKWWSNVIFERIDMRRKKSPLEAWVTNHRNGWISFTAAIAGGALLLLQGTYRVVRAWVSGFELSRRILAYLFRQEISKKADSQANMSLKNMSNELYERLGPGTPSSNMVPSIADEQINEVIDRINAPGGGVFAIVGERGAGKTTLLDRIASEAGEIVLVACPFGGMKSFAPAFLQGLGAEANGELEAAASTFDREQREAGVLIDDVHRLITPAMGGFRTFDRILEIVRRHSVNTSWVFAFDGVIWQFFERMRGSRPLFDAVIHLAPWDDTAIANLLTERSIAARIEPRFESLVSDLPADADEVDWEEAIDRTRKAYYRLIWDYAAGNPGVALHAWRSSLGVDESGEVAVKVFQAPDAEALEGLPDATVFVFRAVVQLENATADEICRATGIRPSEVADALRFGIVRGYFKQSGTGYSVTWPWFRAITRFLMRRHLLFPATAKGAA